MPRLTDEQTAAVKEALVRIMLGEERIIDLTDDEWAQYLDDAQAVIDGEDRPNRLRLVAEDRSSIAGSDTERRQAVFDRLDAVANGEIGVQATLNHDVVAMHEDISAGRKTLHDHDGYCRIRLAYDTHNPADREALFAALERGELPPGCKLQVDPALPEGVAGTEDDLFAAMIGRPRVVFNPK